jgi:hypothetical protein
MHPKKKAYATVIAVLLVLLLALTYIAAGAGSITLPSTPQAPGGTVPISGTGFGVTKAVGIGFGAEVSAVDFNMNYTGTGTGPYSGRVSNYPIKPGSFVLISDTTSGGGLISTYNDNGDGTTSGSFEGATGTINYVTGEWTRITTVDVTGIVTNYTATYVRYANNVTPLSGVNTTASGTFSASFTVPAAAVNGVYNVTSIDAQGNKGVASLTVDVSVPEGFSVGVAVLLSSLAVIASSRYFRKRPRIVN